MGSYRWGPPHGLLMNIQSTFHIDNFIETGTYKGLTSKWASGVFKNVYTIEADMALYEKALVTLKKHHNVKVLQGDSEEKLEEIIKSLKGPAVLWLDAHFCGQGTFNGTKECPLITELRVLNKSPYEHVIFIDDARYFMSPLNGERHYDQWPTLKEIFKELNMAGNREIFIFEDMIAAVPDSMKKIIAGYVHGTKKKTIFNIVRTLVKTND